MQINFILAIRILACCLICINAAAQHNFKPGYVILNSGDSLYGEIDYQSDILMGKKCTFKHNKEGKLLQYNPTALKGYRFHEGRMFVSKVIKGKTVFLEYLYKGNLQIYTLKDDKGLQFYISKASFKLMELPYEEYTEFRNGQRYLTQSTIHQNRLMYFTSDAEELKPKIESIKKPHHNNLIALAKAYQALTCHEDSCSFYEKKFAKIKIALELLAGVAYFWQGLNVSRGWHQEHGGLIYFSLPLHNENLYLKTGLIRMRLQYLGEQQKSNVLKVPLQLEYLFPTGILVPRFAIGCNIYIPMNVSLAAAIGLNIKLSEKLYWALSTEIDSRNINNTLLPAGILSYTLLTGLRMNLR